jgi:hypothetical protein
MRTFGFSTGSLALGDFYSALQMLNSTDTHLIELSALRERELPALESSFETLNLAQYEYISVHAPSRIAADNEQAVVASLKHIVNSKRWPIIVHPDAILRPDLWAGLNEYLVIENMDKRKPVGRTVHELARVFEIFPKAKLCVDLGHAQQVDPTMSEAALILKMFQSRLQQLHVSEVNSQSTHSRISINSILAFNRVSHLIPDCIPVILETPATQEEIPQQIAYANDALPPQHAASRVAYELSC